MKKKILFVINGHKYTAKHRLPVINAFIKKGHNVLILVPNNSPASLFLKEKGYSLELLNLSRRGIGLVSELSSLKQMTNIFKKVQPDVVYLSTIKPVLYGGIAARFAAITSVVFTITGLGYVYSDNGFKAKILRKIVNVLYKCSFNHKSKIIIFQNNDDKETLEKLGLFSKCDSCVIRGSGVDIDTFYADKNCCSDKDIVLFVGRMLKTKGLNDFYDAAKIVKMEKPNVEFLLVGTPDNGNPESINEEVLLNWNKSGIVRWVGERNDIVSEYRKATIVCLPSYYGEGLPKVLIEAAACEKPVITTNSVGCRDAVINNKTGYLIEPRNVEMLSNKILELLNDKPKIIEMGVSARRMVEEKFSTKLVVSENLKIFSKLLKIE